MRTHAQIIENAGKLAALAASLGVAQHRVRDWRIRNSIPAEFWLTFEAEGWATLGELAKAARAAAMEKRAAVPACDASERAA